MKTTLMADFLHSPRYQPPQLYSRFFMDRSPPEHCVIWTAAYNGTDVRLAIHSGPVQFTASNFINEHGIFQREPVVFDGTVCTLGIIRAVFQILSNDRYIFPLGDGGGAGILTHRIWPTADGSLSWPRNMTALNEESFFNFVNRGGTVWAKKD
jgi:hypothetical protein